MQMDIIAMIGTSDQSCWLAEAGWLICWHGDHNEEFYAATV